MQPLLDMGDEDTRQCSGTTQCCTDLQRQPCQVCSASGQRVSFGLCHAQLGRLQRAQLLVGRQPQERPVHCCAGIEPRRTRWSDETPLPAIAATTTQAPPATRAVLAAASQQQKQQHVLQPPDSSALQAGLLGTSVQPRPPSGKLAHAGSTGTVGASHSSDADASSGGDGSGEPLRILVAEDNKVNQKVVLKVLQQVAIGCAPDVVENGVQVGMLCLGAESTCLAARCSYAA
jgi:hypothetical protein